MIQDIMPRIYHNEYLPREAEAEDTDFVGREGNVLSGEDEEGAVAFPSAARLFAGQPAQEEGKLQYLFCIDEKAYYLYVGQTEVSIPGFTFHPLRLIRRARPKDECFAAMTAWHLYVWYRDNRFCGRCGHPVIHDSKERMVSCPACGNRIYPKICPAVIVGVTDKNRIMMTRYAGREYKGNALIAGFCEIGETVEDTVRREVMEEVGLHVKNIRYYKSQPWGFSGDLLMGFFCQVDGSRSVHMDEQELAQACWVDRSEIGEEPADLSLTADMMMHFKHELSLQDMEEGLCPRQDALKVSLPDHIRSVWHGHRAGIPEKKGTSAVVIPLILKGGEYHILYEQRAMRLARQPGEICFPGGRVETGESPREAAIRETTEELLISADQLELLADLDAQMGPGGAPIWPFAAVLHDYEYTFSREEVARVFTVPLSWFKENPPLRHMTQLVTRPGEDFPYELIPGGRSYPFRRKDHEMVFYQTDEAVIWGVTALITDYFLRETDLV
ncbi:MAG: NAD(+) diphosphatase [Eubacterium sp.]|nr:NAD(+) diphosphatase [Eubacterium sp.]